jgi:hypothetical protein
MLGRQTHFQSNFVAPESAVSKGHSSSEVHSTVPAVTGNALCQLGFSSVGVDGRPIPHVYGGLGILEPVIMVLVETPASEAQGKVD